MEYNHEKDCFKVHTSDKPIEFVQKKRLYVFKPSETYLKKVAELKAKEGKDEKFSMAATGIRVDHAEGSSTTGVTDSEDDSTVSAGVAPDEDDEIDQYSVLAHLIIKGKRDADVDGHFVMPQMEEQVKFNKRGFTKRQVDQAHRAREICHECYAPTAQKFKALLQKGFVHAYLSCHMERC